jgi:hypothetical protein
MLRTAGVLAGDAVGEPAGVGEVDGETVGDPDVSCASTLTNDRRIVINPTATLVVILSELACHTEALYVGWETSLAGPIKEQNSNERFLDFITLRFISLAMTII